MCLTRLSRLCTFTESMRDDRFTPCGEKNGTILFMSVFNMGPLDNKDFIWAVEIHRISLEILGLWPAVNKASKKQTWNDIRMGFISFSMLLASVPIIWALIIVWGDMILMIENLRVLLPCIMINFKFVMTRWKQKAFRSIVAMMAEDWEALKLNTERDVMLKKAQYARIFTLTVYALMSTAGVMLVIFPFFGIQIRHITNLTDRNKPLPMQTYYFYNSDKSPLFELTFFYQSAIVIPAVLTYVSLDGIMALTIFHLCGQLENFRHRLVNMILCKDFQQALTNTIVCHSRLLRFTDNIENLFSIMMLGLVFYFCITFCLCGFLFVTGNDNNDKENSNFAQTCYVTIFALLLIINTFLYCGAGELITIECEKMYRAICDIEWYKLEPKQAKNLILLTMRANEPLRITAGKVIPLTMATFCSLLKTSAGYISILLANKNS